MSGPRFEPCGVIPACLLPFDERLEIDRLAYRSHLGDLAEVEGVTAITVNGHAAEAHALSETEQQEALELAVEAVGDRLPLVAGVWAAGSAAAGKIAERATRAGAAALLVFPSQVGELGGQQRPEMAEAHIGAVAAASELPLILFQYPLASGLGYPVEALHRLCDRIPQICAIKDWCNDPALHERHIRELHARDRRVHVLSTHSAWMLSSLVLGCDGLLSGAGSVIADLHSALWQAVRQRDLEAAQRINDFIYPTVRAFYRPPLADMHNRMKEALVLLGRLPAAHVRPPLCRLSSAERRQLAGALETAGLTSETVYRRAALAASRGARAG